MRHGRCFRSHLRDGVAHYIDYVGASLNCRLVGCRISYSLLYIVRGGSSEFHALPDVTTLKPRCVWGDAGLRPRALQQLFRYLTIVM